MVFALFSGRLAIYTICLIIIALIAAFQPLFISTTNLLTLSKQMVIVALLSIALTFTMIGGEIDISVASVCVLAGMVSALLLSSFGFLVAIMGGLGVGLIFGLCNGIITAKTGIPCLLVTLGTMTIARGIAFIIGGGLPIPIMDDTFMNFWARGEIGFVPVIFVWLIIIAVITGIMLHKTVFGRHVYATGGDESAASYSGVNTRLTKMKCLIISGLLAGFAGIILVARLGTGRFGVLSGVELDAIAATVIGGTALFGGRGSIFAPLFGAFLLTALTNGVVILGFGLGMEWIVRGSLVVTAIIVGKRR